MVRPDDTEPSGGPADEYERRYMEGDVAILRARQRMPRWAYAAFVPVLAWVFALQAYVLQDLWSRRGEPWAWHALLFFAPCCALGAALMLTSLLTDHCLRVALTPTHLRVHRGLVARDIPLVAVTAVSSEDARSGEARPSVVGALLRRETTFAMPGAAPRLRVVWRDARGRTHTTWVQFDEAPAFARRVGALLAEATGVRVIADEGAREVDAAAPRDARATGATAGDVQKPATTRR